MPRHTPWWWHTHLLCSCRPTSWPPAATARWPGPLLQRVTTELAAPWIDPPGPCCCTEGSSQTGKICFCYVWRWCGVCVATVRAPGPAARCCCGGGECPPCFSGPHGTLSLRTHRLDIIHTLLVHGPGAPDLRFPPSTRRAPDVLHRRLSKVKLLEGAATVAAASLKGCRDQCLQ